MSRNSNIVGMKELERAFRELGKVPQAASTSAARAGGRVSQRAAKSYAPEETGDLKRGIIMKRERRTTPGKAVYDVMMSPHLNDIFVKESKEGKRSYYPASQEYGFLTRNGGYVPGFRYFRKSVDNHEDEIDKAILDTAKKYVEKALRG